METILKFIQSHQTELENIPEDESFEQPWVDAEQQLKQAQEKDPGLQFTDEYLQQRHEETVNVQ